MRRAQTKQCVAPLLKDCDAPRALLVPEEPRQSWLRSHARNVGMAVKVARLACQAAAKASI